MLVKAGQAGPQALFTPDLAQVCIALALETLAQNAQQLINPKDPRDQLLVKALERVILSFSGEFTTTRPCPGFWPRRSPRSNSMPFSRKSLARWRRITGPCYLVRTAIPN